MSDKAYWIDDGLTGPPTQADEDWYWHHVALANDRRPARNLQPEPYAGQRTLMDALEDERRVAEQRRADEDEAQMFRDHRPE